MDIELHHMRHFVAVAEERHFGRAAARLGMAQPPLSQSIRRLERGLGFDLFTRNRRQVELTPAGRVFLDEAKKALVQANDAIHLAQLAASDDTAELRIGFVSAALYRVLPSALRRFGATYPRVRIRLDEQPTDPQIERLKEGSLDLGFVTPPFRDAGGLQIMSVQHDPIIAALPASHPLAARDALELQELAQEGFILFPYRQGPHLHTRMIAACRRAGFLPRVAQEAARMHTILSLVKAGLGVALVPDGARTLGMEGIGFVSLRGLPNDLSWDLCIAWRVRGVRPALRNLINVIAKSDTAL
jgi:DNA-binding transcriptional LysR family regulator